MPPTVATPTYHGPITAGGPAVDPPRRCQRPGCAAAADATLTFAYGSRESWIGPLASELTPQAYDLCGAHADRTEPPSGWDLRDRRGVAPARSAGRGAREPRDPPHHPAEDRPGAAVAASRSGRTAPPRRGGAPGPPLRTPQRPPPTADPDAVSAPAGPRDDTAPPDPSIDVRARAW